MPAARQRSFRLEAGTQQLSIRAQMADVLRFSIRGSPAMAATRGKAAPVQVRLKPGDWLSPRRLPRLQAPLDGVLVRGWSLERLRLEEEWRVGEEHFERRLTVANTSSREVQLTGVRLILPGVGLGRAADCALEAPSTNLRPRLPLTAFRDARLGEPIHDELAPSARMRWARALEDAPDVTPGLLAVHNAEHQATLLVWYHSETEPGTPMIFADAPGVALGHQLGLAGWIPPGGSLYACTQHLALVLGTWEQALEAFQAHYARVGLVPPRFPPPEWVRQAAVYEVHPGQFGGFRGLAAEVPRLQRLGFNTLYVLPVMTYDNRSRRAWDENWLGSGSPYAMTDFETFDPSLGTADDFRELVRAAHGHGMRLLMDFVPQGCATDARYVHEHPEWFCRDEQGRFVSSHGWNDTYSLDWGNPSYHDYMLGWSLRLAAEFDIDGYRIDAPHAKEPNWDRRIPYHASYTSLGVMPLLERLQAGLKRQSPEKVMLCELFGPIYQRSHDFQYDYHPCVNLISLLRGELTCREIGDWLQDYWSVQPPGAIRLCFTETHDTRIGMPSYAWRGSSAERAMLAILVLAGFVPMVWSGQESNLEDWYARLLHARGGSPALLRGQRRFNSTACSSPNVLSILCQQGAEMIWGVVSLHAERAPHQFELSGWIPGADASFRLFDLLSRSHWDEDGRTQWSTVEARALRLSPVPFEPYFWRIDSIQEATHEESSL
jgi:starch synthase (maltosyl-transferring)